MKNLLLIAVLIISFSAFSFSAQAQPSLKFIDGIELKPGMADYASTMPAPEVTAIIPANNIANAASPSLKMPTEACNAMQFKYAQLLDIDIEDISNLTMFKFIEEWWNTRYRYGGTTKKGIDCSALSGLLLSTVYGLALPRTARNQYAASKKISREEITEGDLVFFNTRGGVSHVGVYLANDYFVHASVSCGVTISCLNDPYYSRKYIGAGRVVSGN